MYEITLSFKIAGHDLPALPKTDLPQEPSVLVHTVSLDSAPTRASKRTRERDEDTTAQGMVKKVIE